MSRAPRWSGAELARVTMLREVRRMKWDDISAAMPGRTAGACCLAYYGVQAKRRLEEARAQAAAMPPRASIRATYVAPAPDPVELPPRRGGVVSTSMLRIDAELRARIEILGITGGLLGDPVPGRSALDRMRGGGPDQTVRVDRRSVQLGPKITLAGQS